MRVQYGKLEGELLKLSFGKNESFMSLKLSSLSAEQEMKNKKISSLERTLKEKDSEMNVLKEKLSRTNEIIEK